jgi:hypothetical protein
MKALFYKTRIVTASVLRAPPGWVTAGAHEKEVDALEVDGFGDGVLRCVLKGSAT